MTDQKIIVPLDGSALAEKALPFAVALARLENRKILLLKIEPEGKPTQEGETESPVMEEATVYLGLVKKEISQPELPNFIDYNDIEIEVVPGRPVRELGDVINSLNPSQVVMTTHGRTGLSRFMLGSVARETLERLQVPVILLRPFDLAGSALPLELMYQKTGLPQPGKKASGQLVVALDGTPEAEVVLQPALELCKVAGFELCLVRVVPPYIPLVDGINYRAGDVENERKEEARAYLEGVKTRLAESEVSIVFQVLNGKPADAILEYTRQDKVLMVAIASHSHSRMAQLMTGSLAEEVMDESHLPVLMMHRK